MVSAIVGHFCYIINNYSEILIMFYVKLFLNENEFQNNLKQETKQYEIITAKLKLFRTTSENISLTDKCEFFRFLPIQRNNIVKFC
jgi:hypothetical protein